MKQSICAFLGVIGGAIASAFGGWTGAMTTLIIFMAVDYLSGLVVAGVFHRSGKTDTGALNSNVGFKGLCKKGMMLLVVLVAARLDLLLGSNFVRDTACVGLIANELISILENAGLMGIPVPKVLSGAIEVLQQKAEGDGTE